MTEKLGRYPIVAGTMVLSVAGYFLRRQQLRTAFDAAGLPAKGAWALVILSLAALLLFALAAFTAEERPAFEENFSSCVPAMLMLVLAAAAVFGAGIIALQPSAADILRGAMLNRAAGVLSVVTGGCFVVMAGIWTRQAKPVPAVWLLPIVYYVLQLLSSFRIWSVDPIILDYCFKLFALIFTLLGAYFVGGFALGEGRRRLGLFFCLGGVFFCAVTLADGGLAHVLQNAGSMLFLLANAWQLLGRKA